MAEKSWHSSLLSRFLGNVERGGQALPTHSEPLLTSVSEDTDAAEQTMPCDNAANHIRLLCQREKVEIADHSNDVSELEENRNKVPGCNEAKHRPSAKFYRQATLDLMEKLRKSPVHLRRSRTQPSFRGEAGTCSAAPKGPNGFIPFVTSTEEAGMSLRPAIWALTVYLTVGIGWYWILSDHFKGTRTSKIIDALYFCVVTMTTVGYGDLAPSTVATKLFTCAFVFVGFWVLDLMLSSAANYLVQRQEKLLNQILSPKKELSPKEQRQEAALPLPPSFWSHAFDKLQPILPFMRAFRESHEQIRPEFQVAKAWQRVHWSGVQVLVSILMGVLVLYFAEGLPFVDALYCACVTVTTVGYGDESFSTAGGRAFAIFWVLGSTINLAHFFLSLAEARVTERQQLLAQQIVTRKITMHDLEAADMDMDGRVSRAEFILFKLKELGKVSDSDLFSICREFENLDMDGNGDLERCDLIAAGVKEELQETRGQGQQRPSRPPAVSK